MSARRHPVIAIVGHIDHGKTTLLDYIRSTQTAAREAGGITQRVSAYEIVHTGAEGETPMTFIDTPGHEAFQAMRVRSANAADIAVLIVAADDGVKPQTKEAYKAIVNAEVPFVVCFTKIDKDTANLDRAKESVLKEGIYLEGLGGDVPWAAVSGKSGAGVTELLDLIALVAEVQGVTCDASAEPSAIIIECARDHKTGIQATMIVKSGTFETGSFAVADRAYAPIRSLENFEGKRVDSMTCGKPMRITGFSGEPAVGALVRVVSSKREAEEAAKAGASERRTRETPAESEKPVVRLVLKADTQGSLDALEYEVSKVPHPNVDLMIVDASTGAITENDVKHLIGFSPAVILGFNVKAEAVARDLAERQRILVETRTIIYELSEWLATELKRHEPDESKDAMTGTFKVLKEFSVTGRKHVIGGRVEEGVIKRGDHVTIFRRDTEVGTGKILNLQAQKSDTGSVAAPNECGMQVDSRADIVPGDILRAGGKHEQR